MILGQRHHIVLIKENKELIHLQGKSNACVEAWQNNLVAAVSGYTVKDARFTIELGRFVVFQGLIKDPLQPDGKTLQPGWRKKGDIWVPDARTKEGKLIIKTITGLGRTHDIVTPKWLKENNLALSCCVTGSGAPLFLETRMTRNKDATEFIVFYPQAEEDSIIPEHLSALGEVLSFSEFYDKYRKTHLYVTL